MNYWYEEGYLHDDIEIANGKNSMFFPLKSYREMCAKKQGVQSQMPTGIYQ